MSDNQNIDLFERYTNNECSWSEREEFEKRLNSDANFKRDFESFQSAVFLLKREGFKKLVKQNSHIYKRTGIRLWQIVLVILLVLFYYFLTDKKDPDIQSIYANYYEPYPDLISNRSSKNPIFKAIEAYNKQEYNQALLLLDTTTFNQPLVKLYRGIAQLNISQNPYEIFMAETKGISAEDPLRQQLNWYGLLAALKDNRTKEAINLIDNIGQSDFKYKEAQEILLLINP